MKETRKARKKLQKEAARSLARKMSNSPVYYIMTMRHLPTVLMVELI